MDSPLKQRLIGAAVLAALAIIFLPMLLKGPDVKEPDAATVPLSMPATPGQDFETRELPLTAPEAAPAGGVLGMASGSAAKPAQSGAAVPVPDSSASPPDAATAGSQPADASPAALTPAPTPSVAAPAKPPAPAPVPAAVGAGNYMVNIGSFGNLANANALVAKLRAAGLPVRADRVALAAGSAMRIRVGPYADRAAAEAARLRADGVTATSSKVIVLDAGADVPAKVAAAAPLPVAKPAAPPAKAVASAPAPTAKPAIAASEPARAAVVDAGFAVQLSAPSVEAEANALRDRARAQGFNSFVQRIDTDNGVRYRVRVGPVADRAAAATLRDAVNGKLGIKGNIVGNP